MEEEARLEASISGNLGKYLRPRRGEKKKPKTPCFWLPKPKMKAARSKLISV
jgi:hypothetical protein